MDLIHKAKQERTDNYKLIDTAAMDQVGSYNLPLSFISSFSLPKDVWATRRWFESAECREKAKAGNERGGQMNNTEPDEFTASKSEKHFFRWAAEIGSLIKQEGFKHKPHVSF